MQQVRGLGKGLSALLREEITHIDNNDLVKIIDIEVIRAGEYQPRKIFEYDKLQELANSIRSSGLLQPIIVTPDNDEKGKYRIVAGERRWRAARLAGIGEIPVIIKNIDKPDILKISLLENIQREELSAIEEAEGLERLIKDFNYSQEQLAEMLGKSRSHIANLLRLNHLPQSIKDKVNEGKMAMGHARCLVGHENADIIAEHIIENDLSVRQTENLVKNWSKREYVKAPNAGERSKDWLPNSKNNDLQLLARALSEKFGIKITIEDYTIGGKLIFHYADLEQLDSVLSRLN
jgi:ParB family chromosome partitioning protein